MRPGGGSPSRLHATPARPKPAMSAGIRGPAAGLRVARDVKRVPRSRANNAPAKAPGGEAEQNECRRWRTFRPRPTLAGMAAWDGTRNAEGNNEVSTISV